MAYFQISLKKRFIGAVALAILGLLAFAGLQLERERTLILHEKQEKARNLVEAAYSILAQCYQMQQKGMPQAEAQQRAVALLGGLRYEGDNYFWINDFHPVMVMHPTKPQLDGTDLTGFKDPTGKALFVEMVATVRKSGAGFVTYKWPRPGSDTPVSKLSYIKGFAPWGWMVGTGIYIDDVQTLFRQNAMAAITILIPLLILMAVASRATYRHMFGPLNKICACMKDVAEGKGDLTKRLDVPPDKEVAELAQYFNAFMEKLQATIQSIAGNLHNLAAAGEEISVTSRSQMHGAQQQKDQTHQVVMAMQDVAAAVQKVTEISNRAAEAAQNASSTARRGGKVVEKTLARMQAIAASTEDSARQIKSLRNLSEQIGRIIGVIDDIADQTNLLALNAAIEAARAGEQGRGFAVVADEVRKLAERTVMATKEVTQVIQTVQEGTRLAVTAMQAGTSEVELGVASTHEAGNSLKEIIDISDSVGEMVSHIATGAIEQATATEEVNRAIERIADIAAQSAAGSLQATKALEDLAHLAADIQNQVGQFRLTHGAGSSEEPQARASAGSAGW